MPLDFNSLPPTDKPDPQQCQFCMTPKNYTYSVELEVCSECLSRIPVEAAVKAHRNKMTEPEVLPSNVVEAAADGEAFFKLMRNVQDFGSAAPSDVQHAQLDHHWNDRLQCWVSNKPKIPTASPRPGSKSTYAWHSGMAVPGYGDDPRLLNSYINQNYPLTDIQYNYSAIKDELLYPRPSIPGEVITDAMTEVAAKFADHLTGRSDSATIEETPQQPEEIPDVDTVLSRAAADALMVRAAEALAQLNALEDKYSSDLTDGSVVAFRLSFGAGRTYSYAAIRALGSWFPTGKLAGGHDAGEGVNWSVLLEAFESFGCTDFEILRIGGDAREIGNGDDVTSRTVVITGEAMNAFPSGKHHHRGVELAEGLDDYDDDEDPEDRRNRLGLAGDDD